MVLTQPAQERGEDLQVFGLLSVEKGEGPQHEREDALQGEGQQTPSLATASGNHHPHTSNVRKKKFRTFSDIKGKIKTSQRTDWDRPVSLPKIGTLHQCPGLTGAAVIASLTLVLIQSEAGAPRLQLQSISTSTPPLTLPFAVPAAIASSFHTLLPIPRAACSFSERVSSHLRKRPHQKGAATFHPHVNQQKLLAEF